MSQARAGKRLTLAGLLPACLGHYREAALRAVRRGDGEADTINGGGASETITGGSGNDPLLDGGDGADFVDGGDGDDLVRRVDLSANAAVNGETGENDTIVDIEHLEGGTGNDTLIGNASANDLSGGVGNDSVSGGAGGDLLLGEDGADSVIGGPDRDELSGGRDPDMLDARDGGPDKVGCGSDADTALGDAVDVFDVDCESVTTPAGAAPKRTITCKRARKATGKGSKRRIKCTVKPAANRAKATLKKGKKVLARGTVRRRKLVFSRKSRLKPARYTVGADHPWQDHQVQGQAEVAPAGDARARRKWRPWVRLAGLHAPGVTRTPTRETEDKALNLVGGASMGPAAEDTARFVHPLGPYGRI